MPQERITLWLFVVFRLTTFNALPPDKGLDLTSIEDLKITETIPVPFPVLCQMRCTLQKNCNMFFVEIINNTTAGALNCHLYQLPNEAEALHNILEGTASPVYVESSRFEEFLSSAIWNVGFLLVTTGKAKNKNEVPTEVIRVYDNDNTVRHCQMLDGFPDPLRSGSAGLFFDKMVLICGGHNFLENQVTDKCYTLQPEVDNNWILAEERMDFGGNDAGASLVINDGKSLWMTGSWNGDQRADSTIIVSPTLEDFNNQVSVSISPGPAFPDGIKSNCIVKLNDTKAMAIFGNKKLDSTATTVFLDIPSPSQNNQINSAWGPDLKSRRTFHACGILDNPGDGNLQVVIVVGGTGTETKGLRLKSTEKWPVGTSSWTAGPDLPFGITASTAVTVPDGKTLLLVGGRSDSGLLSSIFRLAFKNSNDHQGWEWTKLDEELQVAREKHIAMLVPGSFCRL